MGGTFQFLVAVGSALANQTNPLVRPPMAAETVTSPVSMVRFSPPVEITIRTKGRNVLRGQMLSFDVETVQIQTRQGKVISYPAKRIHTLRTRDGRFTWKPGSESFEAARKNAESLQTRLPMAGRPPGTVPRRTTPQIPGRKRIGPLVPRPISRPPSGQSPTEPSTRPPAGSGRPAIPGAIRPGQPVMPAPGSPIAGPSGMAGSVQPSPTFPQPGKVCPSCQRAIPDSLSTGNYCPYCGVRWSAVDKHVRVSDGDGPRAAPMNLPPDTSETDPLSWHQLGRKYWWAGMVLLVGWAVWLLRS